MGNFNELTINIITVSELRRPGSFFVMRFYDFGDSSEAVL